MRVKTLLLFSLFCTNIGEWIYFIALNLIVLKQSESAIAVSFLYMMLPLAMLVTNGWAGSLVDRMNSRHLLIILSLMQVIILLSLSMTVNLMVLYILAFSMQITAAIHSTASFVYITRLIPSVEQAKFNAWKSMAQSSGFIIGPTIAGMLIIVGLGGVAIQINAAIIVISMLIYCCLPNVKRVKVENRISLQAVKSDWKEIISYSKKNHFVAFIFLMYGFFIVTITAMDSLEVAFTTFELKMDEASYGNLVSVAGAGFIVGSFITIKWTIEPIKSIKLGIFLTAVGYLMYSVSSTWFVAACAFFLISCALSLVNVGYTTYIQIELKTEILGRFMSLFSLVEACMMLVLIALFGLLSEVIALRTLLLFAIILLFSIFLLVQIRSRNTRHEN